MKAILALLLFCFTFNSIAQNITARALLDKSISYHDPTGNWKTFKAGFKVVMTTPDSPKRTSLIRLDLRNEFFSIKATKDTVTTVYTVNKGKCYMVYNGKNIDGIAAKEKNMSCDSATLYKNYYTYLYGLPIKLKDPGTNLGDKVEKRTFKGKDYLVLKVTYDEAVGSDIWYFYFNPKTYAMEVYQFFKTDDYGKEKPESGEYILLSEEAVVNGIKMPKVRAWYYNKDDRYLGTDSLVEK
ncbi:DUF6503 family protein [Winogradskyella sp. UBA3174]|uniref:DUF6503 family protein n=1 Tax=Winogradskyella sp. UBA3174 TaxID=1947785 RepID=UPI0025F6BF83|nr:DUF6503 family protein [Winogradskyella sp. UBA3174]|tara:strand:+ start:26524 stop:27243 length:720 start_codon:yes stop_codon:yes gene_type:complete